MKWSNLSKDGSVEELLMLFALIGAYYCHTLYGVFCNDVTWPMVVLRVICLAALSLVTYERVKSFKDSR